MYLSVRPLDHAFSTILNTHRRRRCHSFIGFIPSLDYYFVGACEAVTWWWKKRRKKRKKKQSHHIESVSRACVGVRRELTTSCCSEASRGVRLDVFFSPEIMYVCVHPSEWVGTRDEHGSRNEKKKGRLSIDRIRTVIFFIEYVTQSENWFLKDNAKTLCFFE